MIDDDIRLDRDGAVATIVLNRPDKRNALTLEHLALFHRRLDQAADARCLVLRGEGAAFCAGRDLAGVDPATDDARAVLAEHVNPLCARLAGLDMPVVAAVQGACLGLGLGLAMAADLVLVADDALIGSPFRAIGCVLDSGAHFALAERIGRHRAAELIFTGRLISGREAARLGLVNQAVGRNRLLAQVQALAADIADGPSLAFAESKRILRLGDPAAMMQAEAEAQGRIMRTADAGEGISAFLARRRPTFTGR